MFVPLMLGRAAGAGDAAAAVLKGVVKVDCRLRGEGVAGAAAARGGFAARLAPIDAVVGGVGLEAVGGVVAAALLVGAAEAIALAPTALRRTGRVVDRARAGVGREGPAAARGPAAAGPAASDLPIAATCQYRYRRSSNSSCS